MVAALQPIDACTRLLAYLGERWPGLTPEEAADRLHDFRFFDCNGAVVMVRGPEIHVAAPKELRGRWLTRANIRKVLGGIVSEHGFALSAVEHDNENGRVFVQRMGFEAVGVTPNGRTLYRLEPRHA